MTSALVSLPAAMDAVVVASALPEAYEAAPEVKENVTVVATTAGTSSRAATVTVVPTSAVAVAAQVTVEPAQTEVSAGAWQRWSLPQTLPPLHWGVEVHCTQVESVLHTGVPAAQAGLEPVVPSLAAGLQATQLGVVVPVQTGVAEGQAALVVSAPFEDGLQATQAPERQAGVGAWQEGLTPLAFCASTQATHWWVVVLHAGVAPLQSALEPQPTQTPAAEQEGWVAGQSVPLEHCAQKAPAAAV